MKVLLQNVAAVILTPPAGISAVTCVPPAASAGHAAAAVALHTVQIYCSTMCWMSAGCAAVIVMAALQAVLVELAAGTAGEKISPHAYSQYTISYLRKVFKHSSFSFP